MASATVWLTIATVLSTFNIRKAKDDMGQEIPILGEYTEGLIRWVYHIFHASY